MSKNDHYKDSVRIEEICEIRKYGGGLFKMTSLMFEEDLSHSNAYLTSAFIHSVIKLPPPPSGRVYRG